MGILNMKLKTLFALGLTFPLAVAAATQDQIDAAADNTDQVLQQQQQRDSARELLPTPPQGAEIVPQPLPVEALVPANGECIELTRLSVQGARVFDEWDLEILEAPLLGRCITRDLANLVLAKTTNYYLEKGFITTRTYLSSQDLSDGELVVFAAEGAVDDVVTNDNTGSLYVPNAYEQDVDLPLNIRDLEQAVEQFNAVPGNAVTMRIEPGQTDGASNVVFENAGKPGIKGSLSTDNSGSESTGETGASLSIAAGDLLGRNEVINLFYRKSLEGDAYSSFSSSGSIAFPHGYNTYTFGYSEGGFNTLLLFPQSGTQLDNEGANSSRYAQLKRVIYRDQTSKHSLQAKLKQDSVETFIGGARVDVSSRKLNALEISSQSVWGFGSNVLIVTPEIAMGLDEVDNLPNGSNTPSQNPQAEYLRYKLSLDWSQPFEVKGQSLRWASKWVGQYATVPLFGSQQISVGGASSVRGSHGVSISGDKGYYWQNTLNLSANHKLAGADIKANYFAGFDYGRVQAIRDDQFQGGMYAGVLGLNLSLAPWSLAMTHALPMHVDDRDEGDAFTTTTLSLGF